MMSYNNSRTYESYLEEARIRSKGGYAAVVSITTYRTGNTRMSVVSGNAPIKCKSVGSDFMGVDAMFKDGEPYGKVVKPVVAPVVSDVSSDELPF